MDIIINNLTDIQKATLVNFLMAQKVIDQAGHTLESRELHMAYLGFVENVVGTQYLSDLFDALDQEENDTGKALIEMANQMLQQYIDIDEDDWLAEEVLVEISDEDLENGL